MWRRTLPTHPRRTWRMPARRPGLERLEGRALLAGNVTTGFLSEALLVTGDVADNAIEVNQDGLDPGHYRIVGLAGTTVDGEAEVVVTARKDLRIDLGVGRDSVTLTGVSVAQDARIAKTEDVTINPSGTALTTVGGALTVTTGDTTGGDFGNSVHITSTTVGGDPDGHYRHRVRRQPRQFRRHLLDQRRPRPEAHRRQRVRRYLRQ